MGGEPPIFFAFLVVFPLKPPIFGLRSILHMEERRQVDPESHGEVRGQLRLFIDMQTAHNTEVKQQLAGIYQRIGSLEQKAAVSGGTWGSIAAALISTAIAFANHALTNGGIK
jgi:hypothetical protein